MNYLLGFPLHFVLIMADSTSENVSCVSFSMFLTSLTEDGNSFQRIERDVFVDSFRTDDVNIPKACH